MKSFNHSNYIFRLIWVSLILFSAQTIFAKEKDNTGLSYDMQCAGTGKQGFYLVEVTAYVNSKKDINMDYLKKCAVHGVLFKGFGGGKGCQAQKAILPITKEQENMDFFDAFFRNDYLSYASAVDPSLKTMKAGKKYAVTATIEIAKDNLRQTLEKAGVIKKLGF